MTLFMVLSGLSSKLSGPPHYTLFASPGAQQSRHRWGPGARVTSCKQPSHAMWWPTLLCYVMHLVMLYVMTLVILCDDPCYAMWCILSCNVMHLVMLCDASCHAMCWVVFVVFIIIIINCLFSDTTVIEGGRKRKHSWDLSLLFWETRYRINTPA